MEIGKFNLDRLGKTDFWLTSKVGETTIFTIVETETLEKKLKEIRTEYPAKVEIVNRV